MNISTTYNILDTHAFDYADSENILSITSLCNVFEKCAFSFISNWLLRS